MTYSDSKLRYLLFCLFFLSYAVGQQPTQAARIGRQIDSTALITLRGNRHPLARSEFDQGVAPDALRLNRMLLLLSRSAEQQAAVDKLVEDQHTPGSANYRKWLTPSDIGRMFGPADSDVQTISSWLRQEGFTVGQISGSKSVIEFSGSAGQVRHAFHTEIHKYLVNGHERWANAQDPQIPAALAPVVKGPVSLNNFPEKPFSHPAGAFSRDAQGLVTPAFTVSGRTTTYYALGPADFATIYNTQPLLQAGNNGAGQTIAIIGRSNVHLQDIADFRNLFGLGAGSTSVVLDGPDPGIVAPDENESVLDLERANATAPGASVILVSAQDTETTSGIDLAALYAVENNIAGVISVSYGDCEAHLGMAHNRYIQSLWEQAAAQGITVVVSSGDDGSAGCDSQVVEDLAQSGLAVNGLASTSYNVAVGGTDFDDVGRQSSYWSSTNNPTSLGSALSYIPETTWNESCAAAASSGNLTPCPAAPASGTPPPSLRLWAGAGGASSCTTSTSSTVCQGGRAKPAWQSGVGVPADGVRDLPDVSLFSAVASNSHSFYVVCQADALPVGLPSCKPSSNGTIFIADGGTSAAAPSFAGIVALAEQKSGVRLGNLNYLLYSLAAGAGASCSSNSSGPGCLFNDIVLGNNSVPCQVGSKNCSQTVGTATGVIVDASQAPAYAAGAGYDLATGLGSVNVANLVTAIANGAKGFTPTTTTLTLNGSTAALSAQHGTPINVAVDVNPATATGDVSLMGNSASVDLSPLAGGVASWTSTLFPGGSYRATAHYAGDGARGASDSNAIPVTINPESSLSFVNLVSFSPQSFTANTVTYGSPYLLRMDVSDASGSISSSQGVSSKCSSRTASCPTGVMTLAANGSPLDGGSFTLNSKGFAEDQAIQLPAGTYTLTTSYPGDSSYTASSGTSAVTITKAATSLIAVASALPPYEYGRSFQTNADLSTISSGAAPTGNLTFTDNGTPAPNNVFPVFQNGHPGGPSGHAGVSYTLEYAPPSVGTHVVSAQYPGDSNYGSATSSSFSVTAVKGSTSITGYNVEPRTATPNFAVTLLGEVFTDSSLNRPTGTVTFADNGNPISGTVTYGGQDGSCCSVAVLTAQMNVTFSQLGNHDIVMSYSGDTNYNPVSHDLGTLVVVDKIPTSISFQPLNGLPVNASTFVAATINSGNIFGPVMGGTVTFQDGSTTIPGAVKYFTQAGSMNASVQYAFTTPGNHNITVQYSGDSIYALSSQTSSVRILGPLALEFPGGLASPTFIASAKTGTVNVPVSVVNSTNASMTVGLSCSSVSNTATCTVSPSSLIVSSFTSPQVSINISVPPVTASVRHGYRFTMPFVFAGMLAGLSLRMRKRQWIALAALIVVTVIPLASCGGGGGAASSMGSGSSAGTGGSGATPGARTYNFTVTASSGVNSDMENFSVTFQ